MDASLLLVESVSDPSLPNLIKIVLYLPLISCPVINQLFFPFSFSFLAPHEMALFQYSPFIFFITYTMKFRNGDGVTGDYISH
jgi:hypothetical protein